MILDKLSQSTYKRVEDEKKQNPLEEVKAKALAMEKGNFEFGVITLGIETGAQAMWSQAAKLPEIEIKKPKTILTKNTPTSMQAGLVYGAIGQTEYIVQKIKEECGYDNIKVVATGGLGKIIADETDCIDIYDPDLTLTGLRLIYNKNRKVK